VVEAGLRVQDQCELYREIVSQKTKNINKNIKNKNPQKQKQKNFL
jgi:hypothetical protein